MKVGLLSLGCARTLVDSEVALGELLKSGYDYSEDVAASDIAIVNTCGFTEEAKQESIDAILELTRLKKANKIRALVVMGCLSQRYGAELSREIAEADAIIGTSSYGQLAKLLEPLRLREKAESEGRSPEPFDSAQGSGLSKVERPERIRRATLAHRKQRRRIYAVESRPRFLLDQHSPRKRLTPAHTTYVKISEGCINACSYCAIPAMKGPHRSRTIEDIAGEVGRLVSENELSEINLIGQDTAAFGYDRERKFLLAELVRRLAVLAPSAWVRTLYAHPAHVMDDFIGLFTEFPNVCRYVDLPIEHSHPAMLKRMNRGVTREKMDEVIAKLRAIPGMTIRTAVIVGFPGETEEEFQDLLEYMRAVRFERLGAFMFSREDGTKAYDMENQIADEVKRERFDAVMSLQREITREWNETRAGQTIQVLVDEGPLNSQRADGPDRNGGWIGRTESDAPEVDGEVIIRSQKPLRPGQFVSVRVTDALDVDLIGEAVFSHGS